MSRNFLGIPKAMPLEISEEIFLDSSWTFTPVILPGICTEIPSRISYGIPSNMSLGISTGIRFEISSKFR